MYVALTNVDIVSYAIMYEPAKEKYNKSKALVFNLWKTW